MSSETERADEDLQKWVGALQAQDPQAWTQFVRQIGPRVYRYFQNMTPSDSDIENLASQAMQTIYTQIPHFQGESRLETWVYAICRHQLLDHLRRRHRWQYLLENYSPLPWFQPDYAQDPEAFVLAKDQAERMHLALRALPTKYKEVLVLRFLEELSIADVARILGLSEDLVKNRTRQAKALLAKRFHAHEPHSIQEVSEPHES